MTLLELTATSVSQAMDFGAGVSVYYIPGAEIPSAKENVNEPDGAEEA